jgi:hypothetical protein
MDPVTREQLAGPKSESDLFFYEAFSDVLRQFYAQPGPHPEIYLKTAKSQFGRREPFLIAVRDPRSMRRVTLTILGAAALTALTVEPAVKVAILMGYAGVGMTPPHTIEGD